MKREGRHKIIGLCIAGGHLQVPAETVRYLEEKAEKEGYKLLVYMTFLDLYYKNRDDIGEGMVFQLIDYTRLDGLILMAETIKDDDINQMIIDNCKKYHVPVVAIDKEMQGAYNILYDYKDAFGEIVRHVIEVHGCHKINLISGLENNSFSQEREEVFKNVLAEYNIPFEEERMGYGNFWEGPTIEVVEKFLKSDLEFPDAIVCCNDVMAMAACKVLEEHGYNIPGDIIVTGFDGCESEEYHVPRLTTAAMDVRAACEKAVDTIIHVNEGARVKDVQRIPFDVRHSQSCGCVSLHAKGQLKRVMDVYNVMNYRQDFEEFVGRMTVKMINTETIQAAKDSIHKYSFSLSSLCFREGFLNISALEEYQPDALPEKMQVFTRKFFDEKDEEVFTDFPTKELLPDLDEILDKQNILVVTSIHFLDNFIGYYVANLTSAQQNFTNLKRFVRELGQSLYILRNAEKMTFLLTRDPMTAIYNRRGFYQCIRKLLKDQKNKEEYYIMIHSVDLDGLKYINDNFGHIGGDNAITVAAKKLEEAATHNEVCARFGGDEYVVFGVAGKEEAEAISQEFVKTFKRLLEEYNKNSGFPYEVKASCGSSIVPITPDLKLDQIISMADNLMYDEKAKHKRGQVR